MSLTYDSAAAKSFTASNSSAVSTAGIWNGAATPSIAPNLTYDEYNAAWWIVYKCSSIDPYTVDWNAVRGQSSFGGPTFQYVDAGNTCSIKAGYIPLLPASGTILGSASINGTISNSGAPISLTVTETNGTIQYSETITQLDNGLTQETIQTWVNGTNVEATFVSDPDGSYTLTQVNGKPVTDTTFQGVTPENLQAGNLGAVNPDVLKDYSPAFDPNQLASWVNLAQAIHAGQPLPIIRAGVNLAAVYNPKNATLEGVGAAFGVVSSFLALEKNLQNGDILGTTVSTAQLVVNSARLYHAATGNNLAGALQASGYTEAAAVLDFIDTWVGPLSIAYSLAQGDYEGALIGAMWYVNPYVAAFATVITMLTSDDDFKPSPYGAGRFLFSPDGSIHVGIADTHYGGGDPVKSILTQFQGDLNTVLSRVLGAHAAEVGLVAPRLPGLIYSNHEGQEPRFRLADLDPATGLVTTFIYDGQGNRIATRNAAGAVTPIAVGSDGYFVGLSTQLLLKALKNNAAAAPWEAATAAIQDAFYESAVQKILSSAEITEGISFADFDPATGLVTTFISDGLGTRNATVTFTPIRSLLPANYFPPGLTEIQYDAGHLRAPSTPPTFHPILVDLGYGIQTTNLPAGKQVPFDVDDSSFLRNVSTWAAPSTGILVIDRNLDGKIDSGSDLFSNGDVDGSRQGLPSLRWLDANFDGVIDRNDPLHSQLKFWLDANSNGIVDNLNQTGGDRLASLQDSGIVIRYQAGPNGEPIGWTRNGGSNHALASPGLPVDAQGVALSSVTDSQNVDIKGDNGAPVGFYVVYSDGTQWLEVNAFQTQSNGHKLVVGAKENLEIHQRPGDLDPRLATGGNIDLSRIAGAVGGTLRTQGAEVVFTPTKDWSGTASFTYTPVGGSAVTVDIPIAHINDAPAITAMLHPTRLVYGYAYDAKGALHPVFDPALAIFDRDGSLLKDKAGYISGRPLQVNGHDLTLTDPLSGKFIIQDADDSTFSFALTGNPHHGHVIMDSAGTWTFTPESGYTGQDAFRVEVADRQDPHASDRRTGSHVEMFDLQRTTNTPYLDSRLTLKLAPTPLTFFTPSVTPSPITRSGGAPKEDILQFRSPRIANLSSEDLHSQVSSTEYVYGDFYNGNYHSVQIIGKDENGDTTLTETLTIDPNTHAVKDVLQVGIGTFTCLTAADGTASDNWQLKDSPISGTDVYRVDGTHVSVVQSQTRNPATGEVATVKTTTTATLTGTTTVQGDGVTVTYPPVTKPATPANVPAATVPQTPQPPLPTPQSALQDAVATFIKSNSQISFKIDKDGTTHLSYTGADGTTQRYDAAANGTYTVSQTPRVGTPTYIQYTPPTPTAAAGVTGGNLTPQVGGLSRSTVTSYNFGNGNSLVQNTDGTAQYQIALPGGKTIALQTLGDGTTQFKVYQGSTLVSVASADANGTVSYQPVTPPDDSYTSDPGTDSSSTGTSTSSGPTTIPGAFNGGNTDLSAYTDIIKNFFASNPSVDQIIATAASLALTTDQLSVLIQIGIGVTYGGGALASYIENNYAGKYVVQSNGLIIGGAPIVLDLTGGGLNLVSLKDSAARFDIAGTGERLKTGWIGQGNGLLAYDPDNTGKIDRFDQISFTNYLPGAKTDLEGLTAFDENHDGKLNAADSVWSKLKVWEDANGDGISDPGELHTLDEVGIASIGLVSDHRLQLLSGNTVFGTTQFTRKDGTTGLVGDVQFAFANGASPRHQIGTEGDDVLMGGDGDDWLEGIGGNDVLIGDTGNDLLDGGSGQDAMIGGVGDDIYYLDNPGDQVLELPDEGYDTVYASVSYALPDNVEALVLTGSADLHGTGNNEDNTLIANDGSDTLDGGAGNDTLVSGKGVNVLIGGLDNDTFLVNNAADRVVENPGEGTDTLVAAMNYVLPVNVENLTLTGSATQGTGNDEDNVITGNNLGNHLFGGAGDDLILAGNGNDILDGSTGADTMMGNKGDDVYGVENSGDVVIERPNEGTDTVVASLDYALPDNVENLTLIGTANLKGAGNDKDNALIGNDGNNVLDGGKGADTLIGGKGDDTYLVDHSGDVVVEKPGEGTDTVYASISYILKDHVENLILTGSDNLVGTGNDGDNVLVGNDGNNLLDGGKGADTMIGGQGGDTYLVDNPGDLVIENPDEGIDTVAANIDYVLSVNVENLVLAGAANLKGSGNDKDNVIVGNTGNNIIDGELGADIMMGGKGDDTYYVDNIDDAVIEKPGEGTDTIVTGINYTMFCLPDNVENLILTGTDDLIGRGNALDNKIIGNDGNNTIDGGQGADTMVGGKGNDTYYVGSPGDVAIETSGGGTDTIVSSISYVLPDNVENLTLAGALNLSGTGNSEDNLIIGNDGNNVLDGGLGADTMIGGKGSDTYYMDNIGDAVIENLGEGTDTVVSSIDYVLPANLENLTLIDAARLGTGNELDNVIIGNDQNNVLDGNLGADTMKGGAGDDTYIVDNVNDVVAEYPGEGMDTILSSITYTLPDNVETLKLTGTADINGTGNSLDNRIVGNDGNNVLTGLAGNDILDGGSGTDTMIGGTGDDVYYVDNTGDVVVEAPGEGLDTIFSGVTYTLANNVEILRLMGTADNNGTGNGLDNLIVGNSGNNVLTGLAGDDTLDGGSGADTMIGGTGNDVYYVDNPSDVVIENSDEGTDLVNSTISYVLPANVENLTLLGSDDLNGFGNELDNVIRANTGNDYLYGAEGNDTLIGGTGINVLSGGTGKDLLQAGDGNSALLGGNGDDTLSAGSGNNFFAGGKQNDTFTTGSGHNVVAFNHEDGQDLILPSSGADNTLSLGGGIRYDDLTLERHGDDLILDVGGDKSITLKGWYADPANRNFTTLQVIDREHGNGNGVKNGQLTDNGNHGNPHDWLDLHTIQTFDFAKLVTNFDAARELNPDLDEWSLMDSLLDAHLASSDTEALGGDLAYQYGLRDDLSGISLAAAQAVLKDAKFGTGAQTVHAWNTINSGAVTI